MTPAVDYDPRGAGITIHAAVASGRQPQSPCIGRSGPAGFARRSLVTLSKLALAFVLGYLLVWVLT